MEVQTYVQEIAEEAKQEDSISFADRLVAESAIAYHGEMAILAGKAGLTEQAKQHQKLARAAEIELLPPPPFPEVTESQLKVWHRFLPTSYTGKSLMSYGYDLVPPDALEIISKHQSLFTDLEIRAPEKKTDPVLFGIRDLGDKKVTYLLARWSESRLISFEEVKKEVIKAVGRGKLCLPAVFGSIFGCVGIPLIIAGFFRPLGANFGMIFAGTFVMLASLCPGVYAIMEIREVRAEIASA